MRKIIRIAIEEAFARLYPEYKFRTGFISDIAEGGFDLPCVWLCPLDLVNLKGRSEGTATYSAIMYLFQTKEHIDTNERDGVWDRMESEALKVLNCLITGDIRSIEEIHTEGDENAYTGYGELSLKVSFRVIIDFCNDNE